MQMPPDDDAIVCVTEALFPVKQINIEYYRTLESGTEAFNLRPGFVGGDIFENDNENL